MYLIYKIWTSENIDHVIYVFVLVHDFMIRVPRPIYLISRVAHTSISSSRA